MTIYTATEKNKLRYILSLLLSLSICMSPAGYAAEVEDDIPFTAVFASSDFVCLLPWRDNRTDLLCTSESWGGFEAFLEKVRSRAGNRKIILDIDAHGTEEGLLCIEYVQHSSIGKIHLSRTVSRYATLGYCVNRINDYFPPEQIQELDLEACYGARVYGQMNTVWSLLGKKYFEDAPEPQFPVYGVRNIPNRLNSVFLQRHKYKANVCIQDLREFRSQIHSLFEEEKDTCALKFFLYTSGEFEKFGKTVNRVFADSFAQDILPPLPFPEEDSDADAARRQDKRIEILK
jgi:hypothetical protein